jgi:hypothetical protein
VSEKLTRWRISKYQEKEAEQHRKAEEMLRNKERNEGLKTGGAMTSLYARKRSFASNRIKQISNVSVAQKLLEEICDLGNEAVLDIINNSDV